MKRRGAHLLQPVLQECNSQDLGIERPTLPPRCTTAEGYGLKLQQEKEEELGRVPRDHNLRLRPTLNVYFS